MEESTSMLINGLSLHTKVAAHKALALAPKACQVVLPWPANTDVHLPSTVCLQHLSVIPISHSSMAVDQAEC